MPELVSSRISGNGNTIIREGYSRRIAFALVALCVVSLNAVAQMREGRMEGREGMAGESQIVYFEPLNLLSDSANLSRLDIAYRISYDFFVFVKDTDIYAAHLYTAHGDIAVELLDHSGNSVARQMMHKRLSADVPRLETAEKIFTQGILTFYLKPGIYTLVTDVEDKESQRKYFNNKREVEVKDLSKSSLKISDVVFGDVFDEKEEMTKLLPINYGGDVPFGTDFNLYVGVSAPVPADSLMVSYELIKSSPGRLKPEVYRIVKDSLKAKNITSAGKLVPENGDRETVYHLIQSSDSGHYGAWMRVDGDSLEEGEYELYVTAKAGKLVDSLDRKFRIRWFNMPVSLHMPEVVLSVMQYVMNDSEYANYKSANERERIPVFKDFWKRKDPTPGTAYNEALTEYFRRVDYTTVTFTAFNDRQGYKTDRGRAYILYGPPAKTDRHLNTNSAPEEIWYYPSLHQKLTFIDPLRKGEYKLSAIDDM